MNTREDKRRKERLVPSSQHAIILRRKTTVKKIEKSKGKRKK